jgi:hypothetical protein
MKQYCLHSEHPQFKDLYPYGKILSKKEFQLIGKGFWKFSLENKTLEVARHPTFQLANGKTFDLDTCQWWIVEEKEEI